MVSGYWFVFIFLWTYQAQQLGYQSISNIIYYSNILKPEPLYSNWLERSLVTERNNLQNIINITLVIYLIKLINNMQNFCRRQSTGIIHYDNYLKFIYLSA